MSSHALITASADPFFAVTKAIRAELKDLEKLAAQINIGAKTGAPRPGGGSSGGSVGNGAAQAKAEAQAQQQLAKAVAQVKDEFRAQLQAELDAQKAARAATQQQRDAARQMSGDARKEADLRRQVTQEMRKQKETAASWAREIEAGFRRNGATMNRFGDETKTVTGYLKSLPKDIRVKLHLDGAADVAKLDTQVRHASRAAIKDRAGDAFSTASTASGVALAGGLGASLKQTIELDRALRNVNSIAQLSEPNLQKLSRSIGSISADPRIRQNVTELATGLYDIYSVGYKGAKALDILRDSAMGAAAGNTETAVAVDALTGVLNANIKGATNSKTVMNALFQTVNDGKVNFPQLAGAIGQTLPFLKSGGVSLQEYGAYMADATAKSQKAEFATNNLNNLILKLAAPPKQAAKAFEELGVKTGFAELKSVGFTAKMAEIIAKTHGSSDALHKLFPDMQAFVAAQTISTDKMAGYNAMATSQAKANEGIGATARAAAKQNQGAAYEVDLFKKNLANLGTEAGTTFIPAVNKTLESVSGLMKEFHNLSPAAQENVVKITAAAAVTLLLAGRIKAAIEVAVLLKTALGSAAAANFLFGTSVVTSTGQVGVFRVALALTTRGLGFLQLAALKSVGAIGGAFGRLGAVGGPLALVAIAIAGFATAFYGARDAGSMSADKLREKWGLLGALWDTLGTKIAGLWDKVTGTSAVGDAAEAKSVALFNQMRAKNHRDPFGDPAVASNKYSDQSFKPRVDPLGDPGAGATHLTIPKSLLESDKEIKARNTAAKRAADVALRLQREALAATKRLYLDQLDDAKAMYDGIAKASEDSAKKQIDVINNLRDAMRSFFDSTKNPFEEMGKSGAVDSIIAKYERVLNLGGQKTSIIDTANNVMGDAQNRAGAAASQADKLRGGDGFNAKYPNIDSGSIGAKIIEQIAGEIGKPKGISACAWAAGRILNGIGIGIEKNNGAAQLRINATKMGAREIPYSQARAGDLINWRGAGYGAGSGNHVAVYEGGGRYSGNAGGVRRGNPTRIGAAMSDLAHAHFYNTSAFANGKSAMPSLALPSFEAALAEQKRLFGPDGKPRANAASSTRLAAPIGSGYAGAFHSALQKSIETDNDGRLSTLGKLPKTWGTELAKNEQDTHRFAAQIFLLSKEGQNFARDWQKAGHSLKEFRTDMNSLDALQNKLSNAKAYGEHVVKNQEEYAKRFLDAAKSVRKEIAQLDKDNPLRSKGDNAMAALNERMKKGGDLAMLATAPTGKKLVHQVYDETRRNSYNAEKMALADGNKELRDRASLLGIESDALRSGRMNEVQLASALEVEVFRRQQVAELLKIPGMKGERAVALAKERAEIFAGNKEMEREIALTRELNQAHFEATHAHDLSQSHNAIYSSTQSGSAEQARRLADADAMAQLQARRDKGDFNRDAGYDDPKTGRPVQTFDSAQYKRAVTDAKGQVRDNQIAEMAANASQASLTAQNQLLAIQNQLTQGQLGLSRQLSDIEKQKLDWGLEDLQRAKTTNPVTAEELATRQKILGVMQQIAAVEPQKYAKDWMENRNYQVSVQLEKDPVKKQMLELKHELDLAHISDPAVIKLIMDTTQADAKAQAYKDKFQPIADQFTSIFEGAFQRVQTEGLSGFVDGILKGVGDMLNQMASKILAQQVVMGFFKALGIDMTGGVATPKQQGAATGFFESAMGVFAGALGANGSHAAGLSRVPFDGYRAVLHRNEAVLNASDAHSWRGLQAGVATTVAAPITSTNAQSTTVVNHKWGNIILPDVREPEHFAPALGQAVSRRTAQQQAHDFVSPGGRGR